MTTGGIFQLITNNGRQDEMLLGTSWLNANLQKVTAAKRAAGLEDTQPSISDIEATHFFPMISHFKPLVAVAYEYQVINAQSVPQWGSELIFSVQQFGEFINDIVIQVTIDPVSAANASYWTQSGAQAKGAELISYVNYPGHAIFQNTTWEVNGNVLDSYTSDVTNFYEKFYIKHDRELAWKKMMCQEVPKEGYTSVTSSSLSSGNFRNSGVRQLVRYVDGYQTPKPTQPAMTMFIPLLFWFCLDPSKSIPSVAIPYGQRFIKCAINNVSNLLTHHHAYYQALDNAPANQVTINPTIRTMMYACNIFVDSPIHDIFISRIGFYLIRVHKQQVQQVNTPQGRELLQNLKWPVETIYSAFQPVSNLKGPHFGETWNKYGIPNVVSVNNGGLQNGYNWTPFTSPTNLQAQNYTSSFTSFNGSALNFATALGVPTTTVLTVDQVNYALSSNGYPPLLNGTYANASTPTDVEILTNTPTPQQSAYYYSYSSPVSTITYVAQAINLYPVLMDTFFNAYVPWTYINEHMKTPSDPGAFMTTFSLYTGMNQPSGYINISRSREFYIYWTSNYISSTTPANMIIVAVAINFLLISDGSAVLRFAT
jgi:Major capsid protein N-terminus/Large eukaryotic DNA virus major capsid protein